VFLHLLGVGIVKKKKYYCKLISKRKKKGRTKLLFKTSVFYFDVGLEILKQPLYLPDLFPVTVYFKN
jgi:hypothetical protein